MTPVLIAAAHGLLGLAMARSSGFYDPLALVLVLVTLGLLLAALWAPWSEAAERAAGAWLGPALGAMVALGLVGLLVRRPGIYLPRETSLLWYRAGLLAAGLIALAYAGRDRFAPRARFAVIVAIYLALGLWVIAAVPAPAIDVWHAQQRAVELLLRGENPYASFYANIYGDTGLFGSGSFKDGRLYSITYPPLVVILGIPGWLLAGDVRLSLLAAVAGAGCFAVAGARRLGLPAGHPAELAAVALLFHPRGYLLVEQAWVDPYMALGAAAVFWALAGRRAWPVRVGLGLYLDAKQYACLWLPFLWASRRLRPSDALGGIALGALITLPFLVWSPEGFWRGVFLIQLTSPFRLDALSVPAAVAHATGLRLPAALGFIAAALVTVCALRWRRGRPGEAALGGAAMYLAFFAFNKQAFLNYYWLVGAFLVLAVTGASAEVRRSASASEGS